MILNPGTSPLPLVLEPPNPRSEPQKRSWRTQGRSCDQCGREFQPRRRRQRFCSPTCKLAFHGLLKKAPERAKCTYCGAEFKPRRSTAKFCRPACRAAWHRARKRLAFTRTFPGGP